MPIVYATPLTGTRVDPVSWLCTNHQKGQLFRRRFMRYLILLLYLVFTAPAYSWTANLTFEGGTIGAPAQGGNGWTQAGVRQVFDSFAHSGTRSSKVNFVRDGTDQWATVAIHTFPSVVNDGGEVWYRAYCYFPSDFSSGGNIKHMRITNQGAHVSSLFKGGTVTFGSESPDWWCQYRPGAGEDSADCDGSGPFSRFATIPITRDTWVCYEIYVKASATSSGLARMWINGVLKVDYRGPTLSSAGYNFFQVIHAGTWNVGDGSDSVYIPSYNSEQSIYIDDVIITTDFTGLTRSYDAQGYPMIGAGSYTPSTYTSPTYTTPTEIEPPYGLRISP
jgi:hypothetical protein